MNLDGDASTDEYFVTAIQIFDYCGADSTGILRVNDLMEKLAPFVKSNKAEFGKKIAELKSLLDPDDCNPEITVKKLAMILNKYSDSQRIKVDLEESFNLKTEQAPHDSDSGISTDGLLEELQCELREKCHQALRLRSQLDFTDRQHEEALAALGAERDALRVHLNMLREENMSLTHVRRDYEEASERLCGAERALDEARRELDAARWRVRTLQEQLAAVDAEKSTLQEQLVRSKAECHRINEMYLSRQTALRQENEALRAEGADLSARLQDQEEFMQQLIKEKVLLEMELKDLLNKSNQPPLRAAERSIDVSYTEEQMLSELDSLNADSRFVQELSTASTQTELPCWDCVSKKTSQRSFKKYLWEPLRSLLQLLAVLCFACAASALYAVASRAHVACRDRPASGGAVPWRWLQVQELLDMLLRVEYVADVPK